MDRDAARLPSAFVVVWVGQALSNVGTSISAFAVALWVFEKTGSYGWLGLLSALTLSAGFAAAPLLRLVDRFDRRVFMLGADAVAALFTAAAVMLWLFSDLVPWHLVVLTFLGSVAQTVQGPAYEALVPSLVPDEQLDRANGLVQTGAGAATVAAPALAALLVGQVGIGAAFAVDLATFVIAAATMASIRNRPIIEAEPAGSVEAGHSVLAALGYLRSDRRDFLLLIALMAAINLVLGIFNVTSLGLARELGGLTRAGWPATAGGAAMLVGGAVVASRGLPSRKVTFIGGSIAFYGSALVLAVVRPSFWLLCAGTALAFSMLPGIQASVSSLFQRGIPSEMHGRVMGVRQIVGRGTAPIGALIGAPLGTWSARGSFVIVGVCLIALGVAAASSPRLRHLNPQP